MLPDSIDEEFHVTINNFHKHQIRKDVQSMHWLKLSSMMPIDEKLIQCSTSTKWVFVCLLCMCARHKTEVFHCTTRVIHRWSGVRTQLVKSALLHLQQLQILSITTRNVNVPILEKIREDKIIFDILDFESLYKKYPKKVGRTKGHQRFKSKIKTHKQYDELMTSIENYSKFVKGKDLQYVKGFDTFMNCWNDWVDPDPELYKKKPRAAKQVKTFEQQRSDANKALWDKINES